MGGGSVYAPRGYQAKNRARQGLLASFERMSLRIGEPRRLARILRLTANQPLFMEEKICTQQYDGGWSDVEETLWCVSFLEQSADRHRARIENALGWLQTMQHEDGGWGLFDRDPSRIPTTGLLLKLIPQLSNDRALTWIASEWRKDLDSEVKLTYKGGFTLMALAAHAAIFYAEDLIDNTLAYLAAEENNDGGFGPWKNHPIGSDPWSTGITLVGLCSWPDKVDRHVVERAVEWLCKTQLDSGLWAYHFIDEGSAYAYWGLSKAIDYLEKTSG